MKNPMDVLQSHLYEVYGNAFYNVTLLRVDKLGYWFQFQLVHDNRLMAWCIRHADLAEDCDNDN